MTPPQPARHTLSAREFNALARGEGADAAALLVRARRSRQRLLLWNLVRTATDSHHPQAESARSGYALLIEAQRHAPRAAAAVLDLPAVSGWVESVTNHLGNRQAADASRADVGRLALIATAAAVRAGIPGRIELPGSDPANPSPHLPSLGLATEAFRGPVSATFADGRLVLRGQHTTTELRVANPDTAQPGWLLERSLAAEAAIGTLRVLMDDLDPYRAPIGLVPGGRVHTAELARWRSSLQAAWTLLARRHRQYAQEIQALVTAFCPLDPPDGATVSASSRSLPGSIALTRPVDGLELALTMVHEVQHMKLALLMDLVPLVSSQASEKRYYAPWREDPRPLSGLLQGTYAHLGVAGFWRRQRTVPTTDPAIALAAHTEFARWSEAAGDAAQFLARCAELTPAGRQFAAGMACRLRDWRRERVPAAARVQARQAGWRHRESGPRTTGDGFSSRNGVRPDRRTAGC
jgi:HEXXH motif-containing protein